MKMYTDKAFNGVHCANVSKPATTLLHNYLAGKADTFDYVPGEDPMVQRSGELVLNKWRGSGLVAEYGSCETILAHFDYMFPDKDVREHWLDYFACLVQLPASKIKHALLLIGKQGTGKSFFKKLLRLMLGANNVGLTESGAWQESFNAPLLNKQVLVIEELMAGQRLESYNTLKAYISEPFIMANEKHIPQYEARTPYAVIAFSNHRKPINPEQEERRFHIYHSPVDARDGAYYTALFNALNTELSAFLYYLQIRDISTFNPDAPPPITDAKRELMELSEMPLKTTLKGLIAEEAYPFHRDLVTMKEVRSAVHQDNDYYGKRPSNNLVAETLLTLGAEKLGQQRITGMDTKPALWAIRNPQKWVDAGIEARSAEYRKGA